MMWCEEPDTDILMRDLFEVLNQQQWLKMTCQYLGYDSPMVREFYVNFEDRIEEEDDEEILVPIRGRHVDFSLQAISNFLGVPIPIGPNAARHESEPQKSIPAEVKQYLTHEFSSNKGVSEFRIHCQDLKLIPRVLWTWLCCVAYPSMHHEFQHV